MFVFRLLPMYGAKSWGKGKLWYGWKKGKISRILAVCWWRYIQCNELYWVLLSLVRLLIYCKFRFFFLLISLVEWLEKCFLGVWCFNLLRRLYICQCPRCPGGTVCILLYLPDVILAWIKTYSGTCLMSAVGPCFAQVLCGSSVCQGGGVLSHLKGLVP